jgi:hypothetical protein
MRRVETAGIVGGLLAASALLVALGVALLSIEGTNAKVLVAVWLWLLPVLGLGAGAGWLLARAAAALQRRFE